MLAISAHPTMFHVMEKVSVMSRLPSLCVAALALFSLAVLFVRRFRHAV